MSEAHSASVALQFQLCQAEALVERPEWNEPSMPCHVLAVSRAQLRPSQKEKEKDLVLDLTAGSEVAGSWRLRDLQNRGHSVWQNEGVKLNHKCRIYASELFAKVTFCPQHNFWTAAGIWNTNDRVNDNMVCNSYLQELVDVNF